jgi:hypothetical protein
VFGDGLPFRGSGDDVFQRWGDYRPKHRGQQRQQPVLFFGERHMKRVTVFCIALFLLGALTASADTITAVTQSGLASNDYATWNQIGPDGTLISTPYSFVTNGGRTLNGDIFGGNQQALVSVVCPAAPSCSWTGGGGGMNAGDFLIWANNSGPGTGPLGYRIGAAEGVGAWLQSDVPGQFSGSVDVYDTNLFLITSIAFTSDANGDPVFFGVRDFTGAGIGAIKFNTGDQDFAIDTLFLRYTPAGAPEPASIVLLGGGLAALGLGRRRARR